MNKTDIILNYLKSGRYISDAKAAEICGSYRLSSIIHELRHRHGYDIRDRWLEGNGTRYKEYYLVEGKK